MPAPMIGIPGGSGMQTQAIIQQLIEIERAPLKRLEEDNKRNQVRIQAWEELRNRTRNFANLSRDLYSFSGPFTIRTIVSSDPGAITGSTSPNVEQVSQNIKVLQLATYHQIASRQVEDSEDLPAGSFTINTGNKDVEINFQGGKISALERILRQHAGSDYEVSTVKVTSTKTLLTLRSKVIGAKGAFQLTDPDGLLRKIELVGNTSKEKLATESLEFIDNQTPIQVKTENDTELTEEKLIPKVDQSIQVTKLSFSSRFEVKSDNQKNQETNDNPQDSIETVTAGPNVKQEIGGVELNAPEIERQRPKPKDKENSVGDLQTKVTVVYERMGAKKEKSIEIKSNGDHYIDLAADGGGPVKLIELRYQPQKEYQGNLADFKIDTISEEKGIFGVAHETTKAEDAHLEVNGVEVTRPQNEGITDLIQGASLSLHRPTDQPVRLEVQHQSDEIKKKIKEWVEAHNSLVSFIRENDKAGSRDDFQMNRSHDPNAPIDEGVRRLEDASGIFAGDALTRRLLNQIQIIVAQNYPTEQNPAYRVMADIGISTGAVGSDWKDIQKGLLVIDDALLTETLSKNPDSVRELFASDVNEDGITDNGVAYAAYRDTAPYITNSGGIIASRIDLLQESIKSNKKQIFNKELSLKDKEQSLREKFGRMEAQMRNSRSTSEYLKNRLSLPAQ